MAGLFLDSMRRSIVKEIDQANRKRLDTQDYAERLYLQSLNLTEAELKVYTGRIVGIERRFERWQQRRAEIRKARRTTTSLGPGALQGGGYRSHWPPRPSATPPAPPAWRVPHLSPAQYCEHCGAKIESK